MLPVLLHSAVPVPPHPYEAHRQRVGRRVAVSAETSCNEFVTRSRLELTGMHRAMRLVCLTKYNNGANEMSKVFKSSATVLPDLGGAEPGKSRFDQNFWRLGGMAGIGYSFGRWGMVIGVIGIGFGIYKDHQLDQFRLTRPVQVYVAERNKDGIIQPMFGAERPYSPMLADVDAFLRNWIKQTRWVSPDLVRMGSDITSAYAALDDIPKALMTEHHNQRQNDPRVLAAQGLSRVVEPEGVTLIGGTDSQTYRLDWIEYETSGAQQMPARQRTGNFMVVHRQPKTEAEYRANPSGLHIVNLDSEVFRTAPAR